MLSRSSLSELLSIGTGSSQITGVHLGGHRKAASTEGEVLAWAL